MEDKKREEGDVVSSDTVVTEVIEKTEVDNNSVEPSVVKTETESKEEVIKPTKKSFGIVTYVISGVVVLIIALGLIFLLEKQGRINTGLFTGIITEMKSKAPVAKVNGVVIPNSDLESSVQQLVQMAKMQGVDTTKEESVKEFRDQAIDTLVNSELLRQDAIAQGITASNEDIDKRFNEISDGVGGREELDKKMAEFSITEVSLRRDIENEILIQGLFDKVANKDAIEVSEDEVTSLYKQATAGGGDNVPPLVEIRDQVVDQIRSDKQQQQISAYLEELKGKAKIEILI
jgi:hypothetical protein